MRISLELIKKHRWSTGITVLVIIGAVYFGWSKYAASQTSIQYATTTVSKGAVSATVSGTGQVAASSQVDLKTKTAGDVVYVKAKSGDKVTTSTVLLSVDASDALKALRDAEANYELSKLSLAKTEAAADPLTLLQSENSLAQAEESKTKAEDNIKKAYEDAYNSLTAAFLDMPTVITALHDILYSYDIGTNEIIVGHGVWNTDALLNTFSQDNDSELANFVKFKTKAESDYTTARALFDANFESYRNSNRYSDNGTVENLLAETVNTVKSMAQAAKSQSNYLDAWVDNRTSKDYAVFATVSQYQTSLGSYISKTNGHVSSLMSVVRTLQDNRESIVNAERTIKEKTASLADLKAGADELELATARLSLRQKENSVIDARNTLADCSVRAPFAGVIASFTAKKGDNLTNGATVGVLVTEQKMATLSLNEVDAAKVKVGQKATLTFDAIDDLSITGEVAEVDAIGTVSQGVVSYNVKIMFDVQDERVKPGMSVSASIILSNKIGVINVPSAAVKNSGGQSYVEVLENDLPVKKTVEVGEVGDTTTEIISGVNEGDKVVTGKTTVKKSSAAASGTSGTASKSTSGGFGPPGEGSSVQGMMRVLN